MMTKLRDVYATKKEMFDKADMLTSTRLKPGYANLNHLNVGSPGSDVSDLDDTTDLEELLAQGTSKGPKTHPGMLETYLPIFHVIKCVMCKLGIICCAIFSFAGFVLLVSLWYIIHIFQ
jgi:hypothetical protein